MTHEARTGAADAPFNFCVGAATRADEAVRSARRGWRRGQGTGHGRRAGATRVTNAGRVPQCGPILGLPPCIPVLISLGDGRLICALHRSGVHGPTTNVPDRAGPHTALPPAPQDSAARAPPIERARAHRSQALLPRPRCLVMPAALGRSMMAELMPPPGSCREVARRASNTRLTRQSPKLCERCATSSRKLLREPSFGPNSADAGRLGDYRRNAAKLVFVFLFAASLRPWAIRGTRRHYTEIGAGAKATSASTARSTCKPMPADGTRKMAGDPFKLSRGPARARSRLARPSMTRENQCSKRRRIAAPRDVDNVDAQGSPNVLANSNESGRAGPCVGKY